MNLSYISIFNGHIDQLAMCVYLAAVNIGNDMHKDAIFYDPVKPVNLCNYLYVTLMENNTNVIPRWFINMFIKLSVSFTRLWSIDICVKTGIQWSLVHQLRGLSNLLFHNYFYDDIIDYGWS